MPMLYPSDNDLPENVAFGHVQRKYRELIAKKLYRRIRTNCNSIKLTLFLYTSIPSEMKPQEVYTLRIVYHSQHTCFVKEFRISNLSINFPDQLDIAFVFHYNKHYFCVLCFSTLVVTIMITLRA